MDKGKGKEKSSKKKVTHKMPDGKMMPGAKHSNKMPPFLKGKMPKKGKK